MMIKNISLKMKRAFRRITGRPLAPEGVVGIQEIGYRRYVGGRWEEMGQLQLKFLQQQGLQPTHILLDVGCGALRGGRYLIPFLHSGHYLGIEKEKELIESAIQHELPENIYKEKCPELIISDNFEFERFSKRPHYAIAQSIFTHLDEQDIQYCLTKLQAFVPSGHQFFATFFEGNTTKEHNKHSSHSHRNFYYSQQTMEHFGHRTGL
jgi:hypothetical protein